MTKISFSLPSSYSKNNFKYLKSTVKNKAYKIGCLLLITSSSGGNLALQISNFHHKILFWATLHDSLDILFSQG